MLADFFESSFRIHELCNSPDGRLLEGVCSRYVPCGLCSDNGSLDIFERPNI
jgi:hypothetical protein